MKKYDLLPIGLIFIAEILLFSGYRITSIVVHSLNVLIVFVFILQKRDYTLIQALSLVSLLRIVNMSIPVFFSDTIYWFTSLYGIMFLPIALTIKDQSISLRDIGITLKVIYLWPFAVLLGAGFALIEYSILTPSALVPDFMPVEILKLSIVMLFFIGLVEEIIFRSLLQQRLEEKIGLTKGVLIAGLIFGSMHSGYSSYYEIVFASFAGIVLGFCFQKTRSLPFVVIAHGINNTILFGVLPFILLPKF